LRTKQLVSARVAITITNITFAFFMLHSVYCKINEYRAKFSLAVPDFLTKRTQKKPQAYELQKQFGEAYPIVSEHLACLDKARRKLPWLAENGGLFAKTPFEQSSSELAASFHADLGLGNRLLSITGGLGVDDIAFARQGIQVMSLDTDPGLNALVNYNLATLGSLSKQNEWVANLTRLTQSAENFVAAETGTYDMVFADPDRRQEGKRLSGNPSSYSPDVFALMDNFQSLSERWLIKLSPLTDIQWLRQRVAKPMDVHIVCIEREVKEVLCDIGTHASNSVFQHELSPEQNLSWNGDPMEVPQLESQVFAEARPGTIKSGFHKKISTLFSLESTNKNQTYFVGNAVLPDFIARSFLLQKSLVGSMRNIQQELQSMGIIKANISSRDFVLSTEEIGKKIGIADGGEWYLFFTGKEEKRCFVCSKI
jgi:hypothetical protein